MLIDSHCHLDYLARDGDLDEVVERARNADIGGLITIGTLLSEFETIHEIARRYPEVYCSVGVHPHEAAHEGQSDPQRLVALSGRDKVVGIGETGLDYHYEHSPRDVQKTSFRTHIRAARETGLPVIVHSRAADEDTAAILTEEAGQGAFTGVIHCFTAGPELAEAALELGLYISVSGIVTFKKSEALRETLRRVPIERLLVETDAPYLAPVPRRGKRNEPAFVTYTAAALAELLGMSVETLAEATTRNALALFSRMPAPADRPVA